VFSDPNANATVDRVRRCCACRMPFTGTTRDTFAATNNVTGLTVHRKALQRARLDFPIPTITLKDSPLTESGRAVW